MNFHKILEYYERQSIISFVKVNQRAIADRLNLSTATVSKSLRNNSEIHPQTRAQVIEMASQLGYRPAGLRMDKNRKLPSDMVSICLMLQTDAKIGSEQTPHANMVLAGMSEAAHAANVSVAVHYVPWRDRDRVMDPSCQPAALREGKLSGLVLQHYFSADVVKALAEQLPCVCITRHSPGIRVDYVDLDAPQAMALTVGHLYGLGHRRIGFLGGSNHLAWHQERFSAYVQTALSLGLTYDPSIADPTLDTMVEDGALIDWVVEQTRSGVTAWVTASDRIGYTWCERLMARGLRIPQDVSITGVDAVPGPALCPPLTTIRVPFEAMGRAAVRQLIARIREPAAPLRRICFEGQLIEGMTTGPAAR